MGAIERGYASIVSMRPIAVGDRDWLSGGGGLELREIYRVMSSFAMEG